MYCSKCGKKVNGNFCSYCGTKLGGSSVNGIKKKNILLPIIICTIVAVAMVFAMTNIGSKNILRGSYDHMEKVVDKTYNSINRHYAVANPKDKGTIYDSNVGLKNWEYHFEYDNREFTCMIISSVWDNNILKGADFSKAQSFQFRSVKDKNVYLSLNNSRGAISLIDIDKDYLTFFYIYSDDGYHRYFEEKDALQSLNDENVLGNAVPAIKVLKDLGIDYDQYFPESQSSEMAYYVNGLEYYEN